MSHASRLALRWMLPATIVRSLRPPHASMPTARFTALASQRPLHTEDSTQRTSRGSPPYFSRLTPYATNLAPRLLLADVLARSQRADHHIFSRRRPALPRYTNKRLSDPMSKNHAARCTLGTQFTLHAARSSQPAARLSLQGQDS